MVRPVIEEVPACVSTAIGLVGKEAGSVVSPSVEKRESWAEDERAGLDINEEAFEIAKAAAKEASKAEKKSGGEELVKLDVHDLGKLETMGSVPKTDDNPKYGLCARNNYDGRFLMFYRREG